MSDATHLERESKLEAATSFSLARLPNELDDYIAAPAEFHRLHTLYYDSADLRLARWGCSLRYRAGEGWTLKLPKGESADSAVGRVEHNFEGNEREVPPQALDLARAYLRGAEVRPVAELRTLRTKRSVSEGAGGATVADVVDDDVRVISEGAVSKRFRQLEIELDNERGSEPVFFRLRDALQRAGAGAVDPLAKNQRAAGDDLQPEVPSIALDRKPTAGQLYAAAFATEVQALVRGDAALRSGSDAELLHDVRTAVRRLRSYLRSFRPILQRRWATNLREQLGWLNRLLAKARNMDVLVETLELHVRELEPSDAAETPQLLDIVKSERDRAYQTLQTGLREPRYVQLLDVTIAAAQGPSTNGGSARPAISIYKSLLRKVRKRLRRAVRGTGSPPSERDLHEVRIKAKHVRFAAEVFMPVAGKKAKRLARDAKRVQTILGEYHDAVAALRHLRKLSLDPRAAFVAGTLAERVRAHGAACRARWRKATSAIA